LLCYNIFNKINQYNDYKNVNQKTKNHFGRLKTKRLFMATRKTACRGFLITPKINPPAGGIKIAL